MKDKLSEWMSKARRLDAAIGARVDEATKQVSGSRTRQPLEILHDVVRIVEHEVQPAGRGRHIFPFTHVQVSLAAPSPLDRARLEAACGGPPPLDTRVRDRLQALGCAADDVSIAIAFVVEAAPEWRQPEYHVDFARDVTPPTPAPVVTVARLDLKVTCGTAARTRYGFTNEVVTIGRGREVRDAAGGLLRTNVVAFDEDGTDINGSVSRRHAHIAPDARDGFRLHDDGAQETRVIRDGRAVPVPRGRGLRLRTGDEIVLGQVRMLIQVGEV